MTEFDEIYERHATTGDTCLVFISLHVVIQTALLRGSDTCDTNRGYEIVPGSILSKNIQHFFGWRRISNVLLKFYRG
jgi:hypothetical protein